MNKTSSYLDLSILYGDVKEQQDLIRTHKDGKLKPDCFSEGRLQALPAACGVLLVMLNRFHNHVVEQLAEINEQGRFTKPREGLTEEDTKKAWEKYDEDLFQTGRLITCGLYINITLYDYLRTIVNLNRTNSTWCLVSNLETLSDLPTWSGTDSHSRILVLEWRKLAPPLLALVISAPSSSTWHTDGTRPSPRVMRSGLSRYTTTLWANLPRRSPCMNY